MQENMQVKQPPKKVIFVNKKKPIITYIIIALCSAVFIADQITGKIALGYFHYYLLSVLGMKINEYISAGLMGTLGSYAFSDANGLGASGAVYGVLGSMLYFYKYDRELFKKIFGTQFLFFLVISLGYGFFVDYIDNVAHFAGLLGGFLISGYLGMLTEQVTHTKTSSRYVYLAVYILLTIVFGGIGYVLT